MAASLATEATMFDSDTWQEVGSSIRAHKLRTALTAFGIFWGIFMLIVLMAIGNGLETGVMENFGDRATNALYVWAEKTSLAYRGLKPGRYVRLNNRDTAAHGRHRKPDARLLCRADGLL